MEKHIHKDLLPAFKRLSPMIFTEARLPLIRGINQKLIRPYKEESLQFTEHHIAYADSDVSIRVKVYAPKAQQQPLPVVLYIHGGGTFFGTVEGNDATCASYVKHVPCVVVSVDYRLAPEHPYPAALEDCYLALQWIVSERETLNIDIDRLAVVGGSTGGGLTAALTLLARDRKGPNIKFQMPLFPMIDDTCATPSSQEVLDSKVWSSELNQFAWSMYLKNIKGDVPKYAAPIRETDFSQLPATYTSVGTLDPYRDETINYVQALAQAGVPVEFHLYPGCYHEFESIAPDAPISKQSKAAALQALKQALTDEDASIKAKNIEK